MARVVQRHQEVHAFLAVAIELTVNEFRRLFEAFIVVRRRSLATLLAWSTWRRRHQARARDSHYRRREQQ